jgi:CIC family chloride channel protein
MTEKIARRGVRVPAEYVADVLDQFQVGDRCARNVVTLRADRALTEVRTWLTSGAPGTTHQGFPVVDAQENLIGVVTRRDLLEPSATGTVREHVRRPAIVVFEDSSLREALEQMVRAGVGRLPVVKRDATAKVVGILSRSDLLKAHERSLEETHQQERTISLGAQAPGRA